MDIMVLGFWMPLSLGRVCSFLQERSTDCFLCGWPQGGITRLLINEVVGLLHPASDRSTSVVKFRVTYRAGLTAGEMSKGIKFMGL